MNIRMLPIRATFEKFRRLVHDLARDLGKDVELTMEGADTELDKTVIDQLGDPLMHLIRNSMDHGIEPPGSRRPGKRPTATIHLSARHSGASVLIGVSDDGGGIDAEAVRSRAIEKGLVAADAQLTEAETFAPHLSARLFDRQAGDRCLRPRRGHGRGAAAGRQPARHHRRGQQAGRGHHGDAAPAADAGHHRRPAGERGRGVLCAAAGQHAGVHRADARRILSGQRQACGQRARELIPYIRLREHFNIAPSAPEIEQIMMVETEEGAASALWWTRCWATARR
jgi:two-component system, chemotaxis family, sensor kinase CheA